MIIGIGVDIIEVERIKDILSKRGELFKQKVFSLSECEYCDKKTNSYMHYAARFAAKEAFAKAIGTGLMTDGISFIDIIVEKDDKGNPDIALKGNAQELFKKLGGTRIHLSISHTETNAAAFVIIEG